MARTIDTSSEGSHMVSEAGLDPARILEVPALIRTRARDGGEIPPLWDGKAARRIVDVLAKAFEEARSLETSRA